MSSIPYATRIERCRSAMQQAGIDAMFLTYGPDFYYLTGIEKPVSYDVGRAEGDWITGLMVPQNGNPTFILKQSWLKEFEDDLSFEVRTLKDDEGPHAFLARNLRDLGLDNKTIVVNQVLWGQTLLSL